MAKHQARTDSTDELSRLQQKHAELAQRVADLDGRLSLTPGEELELHQLKKEKLWTKDAIQDALQ